MTTNCRTVEEGNSNLNSRSARSQTVSNPRALGVFECGLLGNRVQALVRKHHVDPERVETRLLLPDDRTFALLEDMVEVGDGELLEDNPHG